MKEKLGLVLEGGAMRGMFTAGVIDVMLEKEMSFDGCVGVSAGAAFGCNLKSKQKGRVLRYNLKYCGDKRYCSLRSLIKTGDMFGAQFCYHEIPDRLDPFDVKTFDENPMDFYVVCTDVVSGKPVYKLCNKANSECYEWIRASASMPLAARIVELGGYKLLDGGISDSIPVEFMVKSGFRKNIVVLTQPRDYVKSAPSTMPLFKMSLKKYPGVIRAIENRHIVYNKSRDYLFEQERQGNALVICPDEKLPIGRIEHKPEVIQRTYDLGRKAAIGNLQMYTMPMHIS
ncbi:MAG: patatin family protein [Ruminococcus sp.]|nr:patatin family protein [Ruminococcus sp.]